MKWVLLRTLSSEDTFDNATYPTAELKKRQSKTIVT